jgi:para-aminobenzoate synthetase component 2
MLANWLTLCGEAPAEALVSQLEREVADTVRAATARSSA